MVTAGKKVAVALGLLVMLFAFTAHAIKPITYIKQGTAKFLVSNTLKIGVNTADHPLNTKLTILAKPQSTQPWYRIQASYTNELGQIVTKNFMVNAAKDGPTHGAARVMPDLTMVNWTTSPSSGSTKR